MQLCGVKCQFSASRGGQLGRVLANMSREPQSLEITQCGGAWIIQTYDKLTLGVINHRTTYSLSDICSYCAECPKFEARLAESAAQDSVSAYLNGKTGVQFELDITLTGSEQILDHIGDKLSEHRLFLQKPYDIPQGTEYRNPQYLYMADAFKGEQQDACHTQEDRDKFPPDLTVLPEDGYPHIEVYNMLESSLRHGEFESVEITDRVCAQLMK